MKKIILFLVIAASFASCTLKTSYTLRSLEHPDHDQTTVINNTAKWNRGEVVYVNGHAYQVMYINY